MRKSKPRAGEAERLYLPVHQDTAFQALASGVLHLGPFVLGNLSELDPAALTSRGHGFDYGVVGLIEVEPANAARANANRPYLLLSECRAFCLRARDEVEEFKIRASTFGDTVPEALSVRDEPALFAPTATENSGRAPELPFFGARTEAEADTNSLSGPLLVERIAGAISMARHRAAMVGFPLHSLGVLFSAKDGEGTSDEPVARLVEGMSRALGPESEPSFAKIIEPAIALLGDMDPAAGIDPVEFVRKLRDKLHDQGPGASEARATEDLADAVRKIVGNEIVLSASKIDDSGQIGLRGLLVFLLAPTPDRLARWLSGRKEVGPRVSLVAVMLSGFFAGHGRIPIAIKAPGASEFRSAVSLAEAIRLGSVDASVTKQWIPDGSCVENLTIGSEVFAENKQAPRPEVEKLLVEARFAGLSPSVDPDSGALSLQVPGVSVDARASARLGRSRWLPNTPEEIVVVEVAVRGHAKGQLPRPTLDYALSDEMAPVWMVLGPTTGTAALRIEAKLGDVADCVAQLARKMTLMGLVPAVDKVKRPARRAPRKKGPKQEGGK